MRFLGCYVGDLCHVRNVRKITSHTFLLQAEQGWHYNTEKYREAITNEVQCKVPLEDGWGKKPFHNKEKMRKEYHEYCPKSKLNSIVFCPKKIIKRKKDRKIQWINDYFKNFEEKSKKKKNKKIRGMKKKKMSKLNKIEKVKKTKDKLNNKLNDINIKLDDINIKLDDIKGSPPVKKE